MLIVPLENARPGMKLAVTVTHPDHPEQELLKVGYDLREDVIDRMRKLGVEAVYVEYPDLADLDKHMAGYLSPARQEIYCHVRDTITSIQKSAKPTVSFADYYAATRELVATLMRQGQNAVYLDHMSGKLGANAVEHATAVSHLSLMLGLRLEPYLIQQRSRLEPRHAREVINLGVAGMLHDIGLACLPEEVRRFSRVSPPEDPATFAEWQTHAQRGYDLIKGGVEPTAAAAVLHHHRHFDGTGFAEVPEKKGDPQKNAGQRIHVFPRILTVADLYDRLTVGEGGRRRQNIEILHLMRTKYSAWIDPEIMRVVPSVIPPFPPGMTVTLSDGGRAVTVGIRPDNPYRPMIKRIVDPAEFKLAEEVVDLTLERGLEIEEVGGVPAGPLIPAPPGGGAKKPQPAKSAAA
ncbi:MAG TPA: HD domain-containing phosphohydrolase [Tepidisphaeraceae bacterium]